MKLTTLTYWRELVQWPVAATYLTTLPPPGQIGRYAGLRSLVYGTALLIAPTAGTALYTWHPAAVWAACLVTGVTAGLVVLPDRRRAGRGAANGAARAAAQPSGRLPDLASRQASTALTASSPMEMASAPCRPS
jgi:hypothetical protein